ncbi:hypothetical protein C3747_81g117 [Trypanosoma cruzi]|uniref:Uncharacterized protein n=1 Tax=Trypanosoma cruzi TaxID=5693 RepID=A0A2V2WL10_TRYCR|nr:hypothetical protein C3747_81g117 [Trypanosoma cruzi]
MIARTVYDYRHFSYESNRSISGIKEEEMERVNAIESNREEARKRQLSVFCERARHEAEKMTKELEQRGGPCWTNLRGLWRRKSGSAVLCRPTAKAAFGSTSIRWRRSEGGNRTRRVPRRGCGRRCSSRSKNSAYGRAPLRRGSSSSRWFNLTGRGGERPSCGSGILLRRCEGPSGRSGVASGGSGSIRLRK